MNNTETPNVDTVKIRGWLTGSLGQPLFSDCFTRPYFAQYMSKREEFGLTLYESLLFFGWACKKKDLIRLLELIEGGQRIENVHQYDAFLDGCTATNYGTSLPYISAEKSGGNTY
jgi:hypothetical protein